MSDTNRSNVEISLIKKISGNDDDKKADVSKTLIRKKIDDMIEWAQVLPYGIEILPKKNEYNLRLRANSMSKRERTKWTETETYYLNMGIKMFGAGRWTKIHNTHKEHFHESRRPADLRDKYKILTKGSKMKMDDREYIQVDQYGRKAHNQTYWTLFPREAAREIAKVRGIDDETLYIAEVASFDVKNGIYVKVHAFFVSIIEGKLALKRLVKDEN